ncbi:fasciclin domain-containing protein [Mucilaginibacter terrae]|uniref:fasciclin domain-containing protein n=1 Tax=Mucilaginibacter terrae TaxID=1955052 RepID=UPI003625D89F
MNLYKSRYLLVLLLITAALSACKKQWDDRTAITDQQLDKNLMQKIQENTNLSTFAGYLTRLGYDRLLSASKTYTVWAPDNQALQGIDPAVVADTAKLRLFVNNHIANQAYLTSNVQVSLRIRTLIGKKITFTPTLVEEATITSANQYVSNGVLHIINATLAPKLNISEYIRSLTTVGALHKAYILRQDTVLIDTAKATVASVDPVSGKPILVPGTGTVSQNKYFNRVANLASEDSLYTYFVLTDAAYNTERSKVSRFFTTVSGSADTTMNILAAYNVLKDVAVRGVILPANLPNFLISVKGVEVPVNRAAIVQSYRASNGMVYVMSSMDFKLANKITPIVIEAEKPSFFTNTSRRNNIQYRTKKDPSQNIYSDLLVSGSDLPSAYYAAYRLSGLYTCQYRVVWRAINDFGYATPTNISQRLGFSQVTLAADGTYTGLVSFPYTAVTPLNYSEQQLSGAPVSVVPGATINSTGGTLNVSKYSSVNMFLQGAASTALNTNIFTADYIKLYPILL